MIIKYHEFNESLENLNMSKSLMDISDELITYDRVLEYIKEELIGKEVTFYELKGNEITGKIIDITLHHFNLKFIFYVEDWNKYGKGYIVDEYWPIKWTKIINRNITKEDPYGEED